MMKKVETSISANAMETVYATIPDDQMNHKEMMRMTDHEVRDTKTACERSAMCTGMKPPLSPTN